jgi:hypothetical protein
MKVKFLQEGGPMGDPAMQGAPMEGGAPAPAPEQGGAAPEEALQQLAGQLVEMLMQQVQDPNMVAQILQMALEMVAQAAAPAQPQFQRQGGRLVRVK